MYTSILFDLDGTLTDPREGILKSVQYALQLEGLPIPPQSSLEWVIGPPLRESFAILSKKPVSDPLVAQLLTHYRDRFGPIGLYENVLFPGIPDLLKQLQQQQIRCFIATSKPTVYAKRIVTHFGLANDFEAIVGSEFDGTRENKAEVIASIMDQYHLQSDQCLMIGDRKYDVYGAIANHIDCLGVIYGFANAQELLEAGAKQLISDPLEILHFVTGKR